jgi:transposase
MVTEVQSVAVNEMIVRYTCRGMTSRQIAERLNLSFYTVKSRIYRMRAAKICPSLRECRDMLVNEDEWVEKIRRGKTSVIPSLSFPATKNSKHYIPLGTMGQMVRILGRPMTLHIASTMPAGMTLAEYIAAIVKDAVLEEME